MKFMNLLKENQVLVKSLDDRNMDLQKYIKLLNEKNDSTSEQRQMKDKMKAKNVKLEAQIKVLTLKCKNLEQTLLKKKNEISKMKQDHYEILAQEEKKS